MPNEPLQLRANGSPVVNGHSLACNHPTITQAENLEAHPEAELMRLGAEFDHHIGQWLPLYREAARLEEVFAEEVKRKEINGRLRYAAWFQLRGETGVDPALSIAARMLDRVEEITAAIHQAPAITFSGL